MTPPRPSDVRHKRTPGPRHRLVLAAIERAERASAPPTVRELAKAAGISSTSSVHAILRELEEAGLIRRRSGLAREIRLNRGLVRDRHGALSVPILAATGDAAAFWGQNASGRLMVDGRGLKSCARAAVVISPEEGFWGLGGGRLTAVIGRRDPGDGEIAACVVDEVLRVGSVYRGGFGIRLLDMIGAAEVILSEDIFKKSLLGAVEIIQWTQK